MQPEGPLRWPGLEFVHKLSSSEFLLGRETHRNPEEVGSLPELKVGLSRARGHLQWRPWCAAQMPLQDLVS